MAVNLNLQIIAAPRFTMKSSYIIMKYGQILFGFAEQCRNSISLEKTSNTILQLVLELFTLIINKYYVLNIYFTSVHFNQVS
jgi:hypothetical protein